VYLYADKDKTHSRPRYLVSSVDNEWCYLRKFAGNQLRHHAYKVHRNDCFKTTSTVPSRSAPQHSRFPKPSESEVVLTPLSAIGETVDQQHMPAAPPVPAEITTPLQPDAGPAYEEQLPPTIAEPPLDHEVSALSESTHEVEEPVGVPMPTHPPETRSRPTRNRKPPPYLTDYEH
jgi:hypothetical protein